MNYGLSVKRDGFDTTWTIFDATGEAVIGYAYPQETTTFAVWSPGQHWLGDTATIAEAGELAATVAMRLLP